MAISLAFDFGYINPNVYNIIEFVIKNNFYYYDFDDFIVKFMTFISSKVIQFIRKYMKIYEFLKNFY